MATLDQARYARCRFVLGDILTQITREYMEQSGTHPASIERSILENKTFRDHLNQKEMSVIQTLPTAGFKNFDISLMYKIARNKRFSLLISDKPTRGWGATPQQHESTVGDNMERIRVCRDELSHMPDPSLPDVYFNQLFAKFIDIARRAEQHLQTKTFEHKILQYKTCILDKEMEDKFTKMVDEHTQQIKDYKKLLETKVKSDLPLKVYMDQSTQTVIEDMKAKGLTEGSMMSTITITGIKDAQEKVDLLNSQRNDISTESIEFKYAEEGSLVLFVEIAICLLQNDCLLHTEIESFIQHVLDVADLQCFSTEQCIAFFSILEENWDSASDDSSSEDELLKDLVLNVEIKKEALLSEESLSQSVEHFIEKVVSGMNGQPITQHQEITAVIGIQETETNRNLKGNGDIKMTQHSHGTNEFKLKLNETSEHDEKDRLRCQENKDETSTVIQQAQEWICSAFKCSYTEDEVESLGIIELSEILENNTINYDNLETEKEMRELVCTLMKKGKQPIEKSDNIKMTFKTDASQQGANLIQKILEKDMERKTKLKNLYCDIERFMTNDHVDSELKQEIRTEFGDVLEKIKTYKEELMEEECPIVVAGETAAGKSSLLNLLLGSDVLPHSLLTCTTTICRLWNKEEKAVLVTDPDDEVTRLCLPRDIEASLMIEKFKTYVSFTRQYKFVDLHWPIPILKRQAIIVDAPGIGSSEELTMRLLEFLPKAIAFIYVINSSNAGGVQSDRLLKIFEVQKKDSKMYEFDPTRAIFVCNKWDQVPAEENDEVWNNTKTKLKDNWPHFKESQMFKLSCKEETRRAAIPGLEYTNNFQRLLTGIGEMISASLEAKVARHSRWQKQFLEKALKRIVGRIKLSRKTKDEKKKLKVYVEEQIKTFSYSIKEEKKRVKEEAEFRCVQISTNLYEHLRSKETYKYMFLWSNAELPKGGDFEVIEYQAKKMIIERINTETRAWCNRENVNDINQELSNLFKESKLIDAQCEGINRTLLDINVPLDDGVTSPLWLPLVIGAGLIALPFGVAAGVKDLVQQSWKINDYNSNKLKYMMDWCSEVLKQYNKEAILKLMEETYLKDFKMKVDFVCETVIPQQIKVDEQFICYIKNELRTSCEIQKQFQPLEISCKSILGKLLLINMDYFSGYKLSKKNIRNGGEEIGKGQFSDVHATEVLINDQWVKAAVKTLRKPLEKTDSYVQLSEVQNLRKLYHQNIVELFGVSYRLGSQSKKFLQIYMEYCDGSLEHIVYRKRDPPPCFKFKDVSLCKASWEFYLKMMCGVCKGLIHVHRMGFVHRDLKLANILVKDGEAKIADIGLAKEAEDILGTITGTPTTMAPEVLQGKMYGVKADIFSLGIILWEMWYARPGYTHPVGVESEGYQFIAKNLFELIRYVINGTRPELETKYRPHNKLQFLMRKCWDNSIVNRPSADEVLYELSEMKS